MPIFSAVLPARALRAFLVIFVAFAQSVLACSPWVEEHNTGAILRAHTDSFENCTIDEATYRRLVGEWLRARAPDAGTVTSLGLGRAVTYPWLSQHIADAGLGKAAQLQGNKLAAAVLLDPALLQRLALPFADSLYRVDSLSYEKVLFGPADRYSSNYHSGVHKVSKVPKVPFDAQLWLHLQAYN